MEIGLIDENKLLIFHLIRTAANKGNAFYFINSELQREVNQIRK